MVKKMLKQFNALYFVELSAAHYFTKSVNFVFSIISVH